VSELVDTPETSGSANTFLPERFVSFRFAAKEVLWAPDSVSVSFRYQLESVGDPSETITCTEHFEFPIPVSGVDETRRVAFERLTNHLGLVAGLSYFKMAAPKRVIVDVGEWTSAQLNAHREILANGLGEFCFVNNLDPNLHPHYEARVRDFAQEPVQLVNATSAQPLVPVGGGKDSCVSIEALRAAGFTPTLITVNRYPVIAEVIVDAGLPDIAVRRILDPNIREYNERGALNGHVPATAIVSFAVVCAAVLHGHDAAVMSNERSASEGNVSYRGVEINHQWSKSVEAEEILRSLIESEVRGLDYFSLLRPLSELSIARAFAQTCGRYLASFSSCNAAFRLDPARRVSRWCGQCPKCQFVYLALATSLPRNVLEGIWGEELFTTSPMEGFEALLGLTEWKPFECVGESGECRVALAIVSESAEWASHPTVHALAERVRRSGLPVGESAAGGTRSAAEKGPAGMMKVRAADAWPTADERATVFAAVPSSAIPERYVHTVPSESADS
jgi:UDP-N-acetyl-alpha-D-muramoyl-L-alanyl-L-glutamate epimerase